MAEAGNSTNGSSHFLRLPTKLRLEIYRQLWVSDCILSRESWAGKTFDRFHCEEFDRKLIDTAILRVSRIVLNEALSIFYSQNTFRLANLGLCNGRSMWSPIVPAATANISPTSSAVRFIKSLDLACQPPKCKDLQSFPLFWPNIEKKLHHLCPSLEKVSIRVGALHLWELHINLRRQSRPLKLERIHSYRSTIPGSHEGLYGAIFFDSTRPLAVRQLCDAIVLSHSRGRLATTDFAVRDMRFKDLEGHYMHQLFQVSPGVEITIYLGCDEYTASDTTVMEILAEPMSPAVQFLSSIDEWRR